MRITRGEEKSAAEGALAAAQEDLAGDEADLKTVNTDCTTHAEDPGSPPESGAPAPPSPAQEVPRIPPRGRLRRPRVCGESS